MFLICCPFVFTVLLHPVTAFYRFESASYKHRFPRAPPKNPKQILVMQGDRTCVRTFHAIAAVTASIVEPILHKRGYNATVVLKQRKKKRHNKNGVAATLCCKEGGGKTNVDCPRHHPSNMRHTHSRYYAQSGHVRHEQNMSKNTCSYESVCLAELRNMWKARRGMISKATRTGDE